LQVQLVESNNCQERHCISSICRFKHQLLHSCVYFPKTAHCTVQCVAVFKVLSKKVLCLLPYDVT